MQRVTEYRRSIAASLREIGLAAYIQCARQQIRTDDDLRQTDRRINAVRNAERRGVEQLIQREVDADAVVTDVAPRS